MPHATRSLSLSLALGLVVVVAAAAARGGDDDRGNDEPMANPGEDSDPEVPAMTEQVGVVRFVSRTPAGTPAADVKFLTLDGTATATLTGLRSGLMPAPGECRLASNSPEPLRDGTSGIDAGEVLTLIDANGTSATIERDDSMGDGFAYRLRRNAVNAPPASDLVTDIPGGDTDGAPVFPAATDVAFPDVRGAPALRSPLARTLVLRQSVQEWDAAAMAGPGEKPFLFLAINVGDVITNSVLCALPEGGEVVLPASMIEALEARDEVGPDGGIGSVSGFGAMRLEGRRVDERTLLLIRHMRFIELSRG